MLNNESEKREDESSEKKENAKKGVISFNIYINIEGGELESE